jgi:uncharacterized repeat protein (TIGR01451 family)
MKNFLLIFVLLFSASAVFSQAPGIRWQQTMGGDKDEFVDFSFKTIDNCIIVIGEASFGEPETDVTVEKFALDGTSLWKKTLGGSDLDEPISYVHNPDGSFLIVAMSQSIDGDITNNHGNLDIWVCKLDNSGNLLWQNSFGGSEGENPGEIARTPDGNYVIVGNTGSNDGDISGNNGGEDLWVIKISDSNGALIWQRALGGSRAEEDFEQQVVVANDGSIYAITGTFSNDGYVSGNHGTGDNGDIWLVKLNSTGTVLWTKCLGGIGDDYNADIKIGPSGDIFITGIVYNSFELPSFHGNVPDMGDIYLARVSPNGDLLFHKCFGSSFDDYTEFRSEILSVENDGSVVLNGLVKGGDGDVIGFHGPSGKTDIWLFKIDASGNILWQKTLGGSEDDMVSDWWIYTGPNFFRDVTSLGNVIQTEDKGYLINAMVASGDGDINDFHAPPPNFGTPGLDIWLAKISANGQLEWSNALGGSDYESSGPVLEIGKNDFIVTGASRSRDGDVQTNAGYFDTWVLRTGPVNRIKGTVFIDQNSNGIKDASDSLYSDVTIKSVKGSETITTIPYRGSFVIETDTGTYNTTLTPLYPYFTIVPTSHPSAFANYFNTDSFSFALQPLPGIQDLFVNVIPLARARPGFNMAYEIYYRNDGAIPVSSVQISLVKDSRLNFLSAQPAPSSSNGDTLRWNISVLQPMAKGDIRIDFNLAAPPVSDIGDTLYSVAYITPVAGDATPYNDTARLRQIIQGSYDPNDKTENLGGSISNQQVASGEYINYLIRFQNTGTDTAFNVIVRDTLDNKLDWSSFQMISSSHPYQLQINASNQFTWTFHGINLPDSNVNEPASHGFIAYRIKPQTTLATGDLIVNDAGIYFDFNLPVQTDEAQTLVSNILVGLPLKLIDFTANYQKPDALLQWTTAEEINTKKFEIERGTDPFHFVPVGSVAARGGNSGGQVTYQFRDGLSNINGEKFYYRLRMVDADNKYSYSNIALVKRNGIVANQVTVNPNPARSGVGIANIIYNKNVQAVLSITDLQGKTLINRPQYLIKGYNLVPLTGVALPAGTYFLQVKAEGKQIVTRFVISQ